MPTQPAFSLAQVYAGWDGYQTSLAHAVAPLTGMQLVWRPAAGLQSIGELAWHISEGRIIWFERMGAPGSAVLAAQLQAEKPDLEQAGELVRWLENSWQVVETTLHAWEVSDLTRTYRHLWNENVYAVSYQWTIWRILTHDVYHGAQISLLLGMQGIDAFELGDLGGHLAMPPLADPA